MFGTLAASTLHHAVLGTVMYVIFGREWQSLRDEDVLKKELGQVGESVTAWQNDQ